LLNEFYYSVKFCIVACYYVTTARWTDISDPFLDNGSVNTFPLLGSRFLIIQTIRLQQWKSYVFYAVCTERL
jgi:hypothetical protein